MTQPPNSDVEKVATNPTADDVERSFRTLIKYARWQIEEGTDHHPTLPSAIAAAEAALSALPAPTGELMELAEALAIQESDMTDKQVADRVRMLMRNDLDHERWCTAARDRIYHLSAEVGRLEMALAASALPAPTGELDAEAVARKIVADVYGEFGFDVTSRGNRMVDAVAAVLTRQSREIAMLKAEAVERDQILAGTQKEMLRQSQEIAALRAGPSEEMKLAGARALRDSLGWPNQAERAAHCYEAMIRTAAQHLKRE